MRGKNISGQRKAMFARINGYTIYASRKGTNEPYTRVSPYVFEKKSDFGSLRELKNNAPCYNLKILKWKHDAVYSGEKDRIAVRKHPTKYIGVMAYRYVNKRKGYKRYPSMDR